MTRPLSVFLMLVAAALFAACGDHHDSDDHGHENGHEDHDDHDHDDHGHDGDGDDHDDHAHGDRHEIGSATIGALIACSSVIARRRCAFGFLTPLA